MLQSWPLRPPVGRFAITCHQGGVIWPKTIFFAGHLQLKPLCNPFQKVTDVRNVLFPVPASWLRRLPIIVIALVAITGTFLLRDQLTFAALAENRERLLAFRDANYLVTVLAFIAAYVVIVAFRCPGPRWRR